MFGADWFQIVDFFIFYETYNHSNFVKCLLFRYARALNFQTIETNWMQGWYVCCFSTG